MGLSLGTALAAARARLQPHSPSADADARLLLCHAAGCAATTLHAFPERELSDAQARAFDALVMRRASGEPVAYLTGRRGFWDLTLDVGPGVLIPRPETELLVELALARLDGPADVLDLGTGSGAIALALATERPQDRVIATDQSQDALRQARANASRLRLSNLSFYHGDWFHALPDQQGFDLIISNPPYIAATDPHLQQGDLRFEPPAALASGADGLAALRIITAGAPARLHAGGHLLLEHGFDQEPAVQGLLEAAGFAAIETHTDLAGHPRVTLGRLPV